MENILIKALLQLGIQPPREYVGTDCFTRWGKNKGCFAIQLQNGKGYCYGCYQLDGGKKHFVFDENTSEEERKHAIKLSAWKEDQQFRHEEVSRLCTEKWRLLPNMSQTDHEYLQEKKVRNHGLKVFEDKLIIPLMDTEEKIWSFQYIDKYGSKKFQTGGKKRGCFYLISAVNLDQIIEEKTEIVICEGYATGATIFEAINKPVVVAFDAGNIYPVVESFYKKCPITICADNDEYSKKNVGVEAARNAASRFNCNVITPQFKDKSSHPTDFNDLYLLEGIEEVKKQLLVAEQTLRKGEKLEDELPLGFKITNGNLIYQTKKKEIRICNAIKVLALTKEQEEENVGRLVEFQDRFGKVKRVKIFDSWLSKDGSKIHDILYRFGLNINPSNLAKRKLNEYLNAMQPERTIIYTKKSGWHGREFLYQKNITEQNSTDNINNDIVYTPTMEPAKISQKGTLEEWRENVSELCINNPKLILAVSAAFSSMILKPCGRENFFLHFFGKSSQGKTTLLEVAASVFGGKEFIRTWRVTDNGLEGVAQSHNDLCLLLDEIGECDPHKVGEITYMLMNGVGKTRSSARGIMIPPLRWRLGGISTGEHRLSDLLRSVGRKPKAGQLVRMVSIPAVPENSEYGLFNDIHNFPSASEFANYLKDKTRKYHGTAFKAFIETIQAKYYGSLQSIYEQELEKAMKHLPEEASGQDIRVFNTFVMCSIGGTIATRNGITGWEEKDPMGSAMECFLSWLKDKGGVGNQEEKEIIRQIRLFFEKYEFSRFQSIEPVDHRILNERAGYRLYRGSERIFYVFKQYFDEVIAAGLDARYVKSLLRDKGILETDKSDSRFTKRVRVFGENMRIYLINNKIFGEESDD